jgi:hypothetical protein
MWRYTLFALAVTISVVVMQSGIGAQQQQTGGGDAAYIAKVMTAAPPTVVRSATIVQMQSGGAMRTVQAGTNQFTCMVLPGGEGTPMCADKNAVAWMRAMMTHSAPPSADGFVYMLAGDAGTSNTDPYATAPTATNHWVKTGPHVMIVGPSVKAMGYPAAADADPTKPYVMWPNTPYAHLMIPVAAQP